MKITKTASGKQRITLSKSEWLAMGHKAGWTKKAQMDISGINFDEDLEIEDITNENPLELKSDSEIANYVQSWIRVIANTEDIEFPKGDLDTSELASKISEIVEAMHSSSEIRKTVMDIAKRWVAKKEFSGEIIAYTDIPEFHYKTLASRIHSILTNRDNLEVDD